MLPATTELNSYYRGSHSDCLSKIVTTEEVFSDIGQILPRGEATVTDLRLPWLT